LFHNSSMTSVASAVKPPSVLAIGGLDPTSGAGISADCAALTSLGCHPLPVITASTAQNTSAVTNCWPVTNSQLSEQILTLLSEWQPQAIKIGLIANSEQIACLVDIFSAYDPLPPIVIDPVGISSSGSSMSTATADDWAPLLAIATLCTPNHREALFLSKQRDVNDAIAVLRQTINAILLTGTDSSNGNKIPHTLHWAESTTQPATSFQMDRRDGSFHGSGCALSSAIAAHLAHKLELTVAIDHALKDVDRWMSKAFFPSESSPQMILRHL
jgi:hydroxymethylpyrimidine/phosphomethylpyrimidine kinase